jgi:hypothetical protein
MGREFLDSGRYVHVIAVKVIVVNDNVAGIDPGSKAHPPVLGQRIIQIADLCLKIESCAQGLNWIAKFGHDTVAGSSERAPSECGATVSDDVAPLLERYERAFIVHTHQTRKADGVDRDDRRELTGILPISHAGFTLLHLCQEVCRLTCLGGCRFTARLSPKPVPFLSVVSPKDI